MDNNLNNGRGMFYAVIGIATLVITIIGATFAYLTASTNSDVNAVTATGATISLGYTDIKTGLKENLIPINEALEQFAKGGYDSEDAGTEIDYRFVGINETDCRDVNGNNICSVYQFTVSNPNNGKNHSAQKIYGSLETNENTFTNLYYALFKGDATTVSNSTAGFDVDGTINSNLTTTYTTYTANEFDASRKNIIANPGDLVIKGVKLAGGKNKIDLTPLTQTLDVGESMTYTLVLWVHETGTVQNDDQGKKYKATIRFTTEQKDADGNPIGGVTGDLTVGS